MTSMIYPKPKAAYSALRQAVNKTYRRNEEEYVPELVKAAELSTDQLSRIQPQAKNLIDVLRADWLKSNSLDSLLIEYSLSSAEGVALMCLAEAMLRIPDKATIDRLIRDKLTAADWESHLRNSPAFIVNAATWGLMLTGKVLSQSEIDDEDGAIKTSMKQLLARSGDPIIRKAIAQAMKVLSRQFVMGQTIEDALLRAKSNEKRGFRYSYDMLGEGARTQEDADRYFVSYQHAIQKVGEYAKGMGVYQGPGISIKLSALHPRYEEAHAERVIDELVPKLFALARMAKEYDIGLTIDAEESYRLDLSLDIIEKVFLDPGLDGWLGFGLALQSYQKRAYALIDWLADLATRARRKINVRLIKGAYWDSEIKRAQMLGLEDYPVFTRKQNTDVSFIACAKKLLQYPDEIYCQFATHNALSVATIRELAGTDTEYEFQCLHGMGYSLYNQIVGKENWDIPCRIYAPVGTHQDLLPYLVRRLLENGANSSFINRIKDNDAPTDALVADPVAYVGQLSQKSHPNIPKPQAIFGNSRINSVGTDLSNRTVLLELAGSLQNISEKKWTVAPMLGGHEHYTDGVPVHSPADKTLLVGHVQYAKVEDVSRAYDLAEQSFDAWQRRSVQSRAECLQKLADLFEQHRDELLALTVLEAGKTLSDGIGEIREAVDFCRYYAEQAIAVSEPMTFVGYTGESNAMQLQARGTFLCISPWNFPLAIFAGQVVAALVMGNCVIAKPAEQTSLIAGLAVRLAHAAGIPGGVLQLLPGEGASIGAALVKEPRLAGVLFTGSTQTAGAINQTLAAKTGPIVPLIAETGGQNTMLVDSSALTEQVVDDALQSAFGSAGQRCSALRVIFLQEEVADKIITMLKGAMAELTIGDPKLLSTDIGPVIDARAQKALDNHLAFLKDNAKCLYQCELPESCAQGTFVRPSMYEIDSISLLPGEVFGPILHVVRYKAADLDKVIDSINKTGYGLTLGVHSRISSTIDHILGRIGAGNYYINRNMIGAVVGLQPFGGQGLSGTGPKAGGPHYLPRLCTEHTITVNTTAAGGNASLLTLS